MRSSSPGRGLGPKIRSKIPPASLARSGGVGSRFHFCTSRTVMNSKIIMLITATAMSAILIQKTGFWTVGSFELNEHVVTMGLGLPPAYWYFWQQAPSAEH